MIIAVDFDGVLCYDEFPNIGPPKDCVIDVVKGLIDDGHEVVLWTTRNGKELDAAVSWCEEHSLHFCNINGPAPSNEAEYRDKYPTQSRKIFAHFYIDDRNIEFPGNPELFSLRRYLNGKR